MISVHIQNTVDYNKFYSAIQDVAYMCTSDPNNFHMKHDLASKINPFHIIKSKHVTTAQHADQYFRFKIENIPVSLVTFGPHNHHPFYNTSQRSGRYSLSMFDKNVQSEMKQYIQTRLGHLPSIDPEFFPDVVNDITEWVLDGFNFFHRHIAQATEITKQHLIKERPNYRLDVDKQAQKIAQEQMRVFISTIVPTGLEYTINISALLSAYMTAYTDPLRLLYKQMLDVIKHNIPKHNTKTIELFDSVLSLCECKQKDLSHLFFANKQVNICNDILVDNEFNEHNAEKIISLLKIISNEKDSVFDTTEFQILNRDKRTLPSIGGKYVRDDIVSHIKIPIDILGQEQRHRSIRRSLPVIDNSFYIPPIAQLIKTDIDSDRPGSFALEWMSRYRELTMKYGAYVMLHFVPYGAMVSYDRKMSLTSFAHSFTKRTCHSASYPFWKLDTSILRQLCSGTDLFEHFGPPCKFGKCPEGKRFCGKIKDKFERSVI